MKEGEEANGREVGKVTGNGKPFGSGIIIIIIIIIIRGKGKEKES